MTTVLRASGSADFLRIVPSLAGFTPRQSVVLLPFCGSRTCGAMRLDLPQRHGSDAEQYADAAIGLLARVDHTDAMALVVYTDESGDLTRDGLVLPFAIDAEVLLTRAHHAGLRIVDALCVTPSGWASYLDDEPEFRPLDPASALLAAPDIGDVRGDQLSGVELPRVNKAERESVIRAQQDLAHLLARAGGSPPTGKENPQAIAALTLLEDIPEFLESLLDSPETMPTFAVATLPWCLDRPLFRDVALIQWATNRAGGMRALDAQLAFSETRAGVPDELGDVFLGRGATPEADRLRLALRVVRTVAARAPKRSQPGPLTIAAWLSWALGRSSHAAWYLERVHDIDPEYGLAALLETMISAALLPEWVFRRGAGAAI